jgi:hypothetical protein
MIARFVDFSKELKGWGAGIGEEEYVILG